MEKLVNISKTLQLKKKASVNEFTTRSIRCKAWKSNEKFSRIMLGLEIRPGAITDIDEFEKK